MLPRPASEACMAWRGVVWSTYDDDDEVQPTPGVRVVLLEAVRHHLDDHLEYEDDRERPVGIV